MPTAEATHEPTALRVPERGVRSLFSIDSRWQAWLDVEVALARAEAELGIIPQAAAEEIARKAKVENLDQDRVLDGLHRTGHTLVPVVWELAEICDGDSGGYVHWGATTQNITQTGEVLLLRKAHGIFLVQLGEILGEMSALAKRTRDFVLPGRTHGQHAVPVTFGYKVAAWIDELLRHVERLRSLESRCFTAMLGGAAGSFASFGEQGFEVQRRFAEQLGLAPMAVPSRAVGDRFGEYVTTLGLLAATTGKIGQEVYESMKFEFGELEEPVPDGTVGSSTMPQKRNPNFSQDITSVSAQIRGLVPVALEAMLTEHEANRANDMLMRRTLESACMMTEEVLERVRIVIAGLTVRPERMRRNLDLSGGLILAEAMMLKLGESIGRQEAHDVIYDVAQAAAKGGPDFAAGLKSHEAVAARLDGKEIDQLLDPVAYAGLCAQMADESAIRAEQMAAELEDPR